MLIGRFRLGHRPGPRPIPAKIVGDLGLIELHVLCGFPTCGGVIIEQVLYQGSDAPAALLFHPGYVQRDAGVWVLGRHAAKKVGNLPRRVRWSRSPSAGTLVVRRQDGTLALGYMGYVDDLGRSVLRVKEPGQFAELTRGDPLTVACMQHGHYSVVRFEDLERVCARALP